MAHDPTSSSRQRLTGVKPREWFIGSTFARLLAAAVGAGERPGLERLTELHETAKVSAMIAFPEIPVPDNKDALIRKLRLALRDMREAFDPYAPTRPEAEACDDADKALAEADGLVGPLPDEPATPEAPASIPARRGRLTMELVSDDGLRGHRYALQIDGHDVATMEHDEGNERSTDAEMALVFSTLAILLDSTLTFTETTPEGEALRRAAEKG